MKAKRKPLDQLSRKKVCTGKELAAALEQVELSSEEAVAWQNDILKGRKALKRASSKWDRH